MKSIINQKNHFLNDEHRFNPTVSGEKYHRNPFFDFDADFYDQKKVSILKYIPEQKRFLLIY
jgi:hypothetical protein